MFPDCAWHTVVVLHEEKRVVEVYNIQSKVGSSRLSVPSKSTTHEMRRLTER